MNKTNNTLKGNPLPPGLISNLQQVLSAKKEEQPQPQPSSPSSSSHENSNNVNDSTEPSTSGDGVVVVEEEDCSKKPILLVTNGDGIDSPGLTHLVEALVRLGLYNVHVCAPQSDKSMSGHSMTFRETVAVTSAEINGATAYEVSGTPVDCVSLALSGALFSWSKPLLVISGINRGSSCGHQMLYSGVVAGAREALICGVPSLSISLNWKKDESQESDFKDAVDICLPLITAAVRGVEKGVFPKDCSFSIEVPTSPSTNKGFKLTKQSIWRSSPSWQAVSANRHPSSGHFMSNQQSLGLQLAQLSRDASAAGAARRLNTQKKSMVEIESIGAAGKPNNDRVKKYFRLEFTHKEHQQDEDEELDIKALEAGYVTVTPLSLSSISQSDVQSAASEWISSVSQHDP